MKHRRASETQPVIMANQSVFSTVETISLFAGALQRHTVALH